MKLLFFVPVLLFLLYDASSALEILSDRIKNPPIEPPTPRDDPPAPEDKDEIPGMLPPETKQEEAEEGGVKKDSHGIKDIW